MTDYGSGGYAGRSMSNRARKAYSYGEKLYLNGAS